MLDEWWPVVAVGGVCGAEVGGSREAEGRQFGEVPEGLFEAWEVDFVADQGKVEGSEIVAFGERWEAVGSGRY